MLVKSIKVTDREEFGKYTRYQVTFISGKMYNISCETDSELSNSLEKLSKNKEVQDINFIKDNNGKIQRAELIHVQSKTKSRDDYAKGQIKGNSVTNGINIAIAKYHDNDRNSTGNYELTKENILKEIRMVMGIHEEIENE